MKIGKAQVSANIMRLGSHHETPNHWWTKHMLLFLSCLTTKIALRKPIFVYFRQESFLTGQGAELPGADPNTRIMIIGRTILIEEGNMRYMRECVVLCSGRRDECS